MGAGDQSGVRPTGPSQVLDQLVVPVVGREMHRRVALSVLLVDQFLPDLLDLAAIVTHDYLESLGNQQTHHCLVNALLLFGLRHRGRVHFDAHQLSLESQ